MQDSQCLRVCVSVGGVGAGEDFEVQNLAAALEIRQARNKHRHCMQSTASSNRSLTGPGPTDPEPKSR